MKKSIKKLSLKTETVRQLQSQDLIRVVGGVTNTCQTGNPCGITGPQNSCYTACGQQGCPTGSLCTLSCNFTACYCSLYPTCGNG